jgi:hypothetical protein
VKLLNRFNNSIKSYIIGDERISVSEALCKDSYKDKQKEHKLYSVRMLGLDFFYLEEFLKMAPLCRKLQEVNTFQNILI